MVKPLLLMVQINYLILNGIRSCYIGTLGFFINSKK